jgi:hypothetical protein
LQAYTGVSTLSLYWSEYLIVLSSVHSH